jgi:hypothetical protein
MKIANLRLFNLDMQIEYTSGKDWIEVGKINGKFRDLTEDHNAKLLMAVYEYELSNKAIV